jgi:hypothetical protein
MHQVTAIVQKTDQEVVMVVARNGSQRAHTFDAPLNRYHGMALSWLIGLWWTPPHPHCRLPAREER